MSQKILILAGVISAQSGPGQFVSINDRERQLSAKPYGKPIIIFGMMKKTSISMHQYIKSRFNWQKYFFLRRIETKT